MLDIIYDTALDVLKLLPLLFLTYLLMEYMESKMSERAQKAIADAGAFSVPLASLLGAVPQCGFSASASGLYAGGVISYGTLIAVYLSTSDEMLPIMLSSGAPAGAIIKIIACKVLIGIAAGYLTDMLMHSKHKGENTISNMCTDENCNCEENGVFLSALKHTLNVALFIAVITLILNAAIAFIGTDALSAFIGKKAYLSEVITGLIGLIPNCASSVVITQLYLSKVIDASSMLTGLLCNSGVGLLVLFRLNKNTKENLKTVALLYFISVIVGMLCRASGISF